MSATFQQLPQQQWTNFHGTITQSLKAFYDLRNGPGSPPSTPAGYNTTSAGIQQLLSGAVSAGVRARALGAGWSYSAVAAVDGWLLNTQPLNMNFMVQGTAIADGYQGDRQGLWFLQCGMGIAQTSAVLRAQGRSLRASGASNGQTIAGAIATGTHGAAIDAGAIHNAVVALHLLLGKGRSIVLQRGTTPAVSRDFASAINAQLVSDDELFRAALVSFGSFGFVHGVVIETDPLFLLNAYRRRIRLASLERCMQSLRFDIPDLPSTARPYHFQVVVNPNDLSTAIVTSMYRAQYSAGYSPPAAAAPIGPGDDAAAVIALVADVAPPLIPTLVTTVVNSQYTDYGPATGTLTEIFNNTDNRGADASTALGIDAAHSIDVLDALLFEYRRSGPAPVLFSFRYIAGSDATLAFARVPSSVVVEIDGVRNRITEAFFAAAWQRLRDEGLPFAFHWGKMNDLSAKGVRDIYGPNVERWVGARESFMSAAERQLFSNDFLIRLQMDS